MSAAPYIYTPLVPAPDQRSAFTRRCVGLAFDGTRCGLTVEQRCGDRHAPLCYFHEDREAANRTSFAAGPALMTKSSPPSAVATPRPEGSPPRCFLCGKKLTSIFGAVAVYATPSQVPPEPKFLKGYAHERCLKLS